MSAQNIAIDGPVGSGKSTVARLVAQKLDCRHIDSGAVYRAVARLVQAKNLSLQKPESIAEAAQKATIEYREPNILIDGKDIAGEIRTQEIAQLASQISAMPDVRSVVTAKLQAMAKGGNVVMDGRDIGTVVLPDADVKIFLTAQIEIRARRRQKELEVAGKKIVLQELVREIKERDERDSNRAAAPLRAAADAVIIDTDRLTVDEVVARIVSLCITGQGT